MVVPGSVAASQSARSVRLSPARDQRPFLTRSSTATRHEEVACSLLKINTSQQIEAAVVAQFKFFVQQFPGSICVYWTEGSVDQELLSGRFL
jgi:hypothetical protein